MCYRVQLRGDRLYYPLRVACMVRTLGTEREEEEMTETQIIIVACSVVMFLWCIYVGRAIYKYIKNKKGGNENDKDGN